MGSLLDELAAKQKTGLRAVGHAGRGKGPPEGSSASLSAELATKLAQRRERMSFTSPNERPSKPVAKWSMSKDSLWTS
jgi:hypothetical protein